MEALYSRLESYDPGLKNGNSNVAFSKGIGRSRGENRNLVRKILKKKFLKLKLFYRFGHSGASHPSLFWPLALFGS